MAAQRQPQSNHNFEIAFMEGLHRRDPLSVETMELLAGYYTKAGRIDDGLRLDEQLVRAAPDNPTHHYNLACSLALKDRTEEALEALRIALDKGYDDRDWMLKDPDLDPLREHPEFIALLDAFEDADPESAL